MSTLKTPERQVGREYCDECGIDPVFYKNQIYSLTEKLEFSTMQLLKLSAECDRLRKELCEAEFIGRSSVSRRPPPPLPNELLREIFSFATHLESDLVAPYWELERPYAPWVISSQARRSIPLVCRQWHLAGLEYLYEHIIIYTPSQLSKLLDVFKGLEHDAQLHAQYVGWIRGLEFIILRHDVDSEKEFTLGACDLIYRLPRGRLRVFGFGDAQRHYHHHYHGRDCNNILEIMRAGIIVSQRSSEALHFPVLSFNSLSVEEGPSADLENPVLGANMGTVESIDFHKLVVLSLVNGQWDEGGRTAAEDDSFFTSHVHSIRTVYLRRFKRTSYIHLRAAAHLETIHILDDLTGFNAENFDQFLKAVPRLRRLVINLDYESVYGPTIVTNGAVIHTSLEEITLIMNSVWDYRTVEVIYPIFSKIQNKCLPKLTRVVVCGPYPNGWLDAAVHEARYERRWKLAIQACEERGVDLVDEKGNAIHLWRAGRGFKVGPESDVTDTDTASDEGEWWEISTSGYKGSVGADGDIISEDSEDSPYRYVSQPDVDYDRSSDSSES